MEDFDRGFAEAVERHRAGHRDEALQAYRRLLALRSDHMFSWWNLALIHDQLGSWAPAAAAWRRFLALEPSSVLASAFLGKALFKNGAPKAALAPLRRALRDPGLDSVVRTAARTHLVEALHRLQDWNAMAREARNALDPDRPSPPMRYSLGLALHHQGRWLEARDVYERLLAETDDTPPLPGYRIKARENLARAEQERRPQDHLTHTIPEGLAASDRNAVAGRLEDAERFCRIVLQQFPRHPGALARLARLARLTGSPDAVALAEEAAEADPHRQLHAWALQGSGRLDEAIRALAPPPASPNPASVLRVVWRSDPDTLWESAWLRQLLAGVGCEHRTSLPDSADGLPILIVSGLPTPAQEREHAALAARGARLGLVLLSDEYYTTPASVGAPFRLILRNYWSGRLAADPRVTVFPLGYKQGIASPGPVPEMDARPHAWCFMGNVTTPARQDMLNHLRHVPGGFLHRTDSFHDAKALPVEDYAAKLRQTRFVPCPAGNNLETFRVYEALECGAIPIVEEWFADPYYSRLLGPCPFPLLRRWSEAPALIADLLSDPTRLAGRQRECRIWWDRTKRYFADTVASRVRSELLG